VLESWEGSIWIYCVGSTARYYTPSYCDQAHMSMYEVHNPQFVEKCGEPKTERRSNLIYYFCCGFWLWLNEPLYCWLNISLKIFIFIYELHNYEYNQSGWRRGFINDPLRIYIKNFFRKVCDGNKNFLVQSYGRIYELFKKLLNFWKTVKFYILQYR